MFASPEAVYYVAAMRLSTLALAVLIASAAGSAPRADERRDDAAAWIVLFGAGWCAPCTAEYRDLPRLAAAASPDRVVLAWIDAPPPPPPQATAVRLLPVDTSRRLARRLGGEGYGLPFAAMVDATGNACAVWRAPLRAEDVPRLRTACARRLTRASGAAG